jgi:hypothetical protein
MSALARAWARLAEAILGKAGLAVWEPEAPSPEPADTPGDFVSWMDLREPASPV